MTHVLGQVVLSRHADRFDGLPRIQRGLCSQRMYIKRGDDAGGEVVSYQQFRNVNRERYCQPKFVLASISPLPDGTDKNAGCNEINSTLLMSVD